MISLTHPSTSDSPIRLNIETDSSGAMAALDMLIPNIQTEIGNTNELFADLALVKMQEKVSVDLGNLRDSLHIERDGPMDVGIAPNDQTEKYIYALEFGARPHWTSVHNLEGWSGRHGWNAYALQALIAKYGTQPHPFIIPTAEELTPEYETAVMEALTRACLSASTGAV